MNKLLKYVLIVNLILLILIGIVALMGILGENYNGSNTAPREGLEVKEPRNPYSTLGTIAFFIAFYILPLFAVAMAVIYQFKEPYFLGYLKSLIIPITTIIVAFLMSAIWGSRLQGEEGMVILLFIGVWIAVFILVLIINLIIFLVKRTTIGKKKK